MGSFVDVSISPWEVTDCVHLQSRQRMERLEDHSKCRSDVDWIHGLKG